jgi:hypothetical protein
MLACAIKFALSVGLVLSAKYGAAHRSVYAGGTYERTYAVASIVGART